MANGGNDRGGRSARAGAFLQEVLKSIAIDATRWGIYAVAGVLLALLVVAITTDAEVPIWLTASLVLLALGAGTVGCRHVVKRLRTGYRSLKADYRSLEVENNQLARVVDRHLPHWQHVVNALERLQRVMAGEMGTTNTAVYVEVGLLQPARDLLRDEGACDVRLAVLAPHETKDEYLMLWASGHDFDSRQKLDLTVSGSLSKATLLDGQLHDWPDLRRDEHPSQRSSATSERYSLCSLPLKHGSKTVGVLNVLWEKPYAYDDEAIRYATAIASVTQIVLALALDLVDDGDGSD